MAIFNPKITSAGNAALLNARNTGVELELTHIAFGTAGYDPVGTETSLKGEVKRIAIGAGVRITPNQIRVAAIWMSDTETASIQEVGFYAGTTLFAVASRATGGAYLTKTAGANLIFSYDWTITAVAASSITVSVDPDALALLVHMADVNAHPQYLTIAEYQRRDNKSSVRAATTANITLSGLQTIDGVALASGDRILVKNQATASNNGIYVVSTSTWQRAEDADAALEVTPGMLVPVERGVAAADSIWQLTTDGAITLGVTSLSFEMVAGQSGVSVGTYRSVTVDKLGRVTGGSNPTTLSGYGIASASQAEAEAGMDETKPATSKSVFQAIDKKVVPATTSVQGIVELATDAETQAGTDAARGVTPAGLKSLMDLYTFGTALVTTTKTLTTTESASCRVDATAGAITLTLPAASTVRDAYMRRVDVTQNALVIRAAGTDKLMLDTAEAAAGQTQTELLFAGDWLHLRSDGTGKWWCLDQAQLPGSIASGLLSYGVAGVSALTVPPVLRSGRRRARVTVVGGGGGGGSSSTTAARGAGGGAGGATIGLFSLTGVSSVNVTVGAGSTTSGGTSSFGTYCSATGGAAGENYAGGNTAGGAGGAGTGGTLNLSGGYGSDGPVQSGAGTGGSGDGGTSLFGGSGRSAGGAGAPGVTPGGGGGGSSIASRSRGADGAVIIEW